MPCDKQDGPTIDPSGQEVAPVNLSARQAKEAGLLTSGTYGRHSTGSSASESLMLSLVSRLRVRTALLGSTLFNLIWKQRNTPLLHSIFALRASVPRTSDSGCSSWPTPQAIDSQGRGRAGRLKKDGNRNPELPGSFRRDLKDDAMLAAWPTPMANKLTPQTRDDFTPNLPAIALLATWQTPTVQDAHGSNQKNGGAILSLLGEARQTDSGQTPNGSTAEMENTGQLNPAHSRWLMGLPPEWDDCAATAMQSSRRSRKRS
jgi:hypothetical protein